jgi:hypothetical protein
MHYMLWKQVHACSADIGQGYINKPIDDMPSNIEAVQMARGEVSQFEDLDLVNIMYKTLSL